MKYLFPKSLITGFPIKDDSRKSEKLYGELSYQGNANVAIQAIPST